MPTHPRQKPLLQPQKLTVVHASVALSFRTTIAKLFGIASISQTTPLLTQSSTSASTSNSSPVSPHLTLEPAPDAELSSLDPSSKDFVSRVSRLPVVNTALKAYEHSKERSRVVKVPILLLSVSLMHPDMPCSVWSQLDGILRENNLSSRI